MNKTYRLDLNAASTCNKEYGQLGVDVAYSPARWLLDLSKGKAGAQSMSNPSRLQLPARSRAAGRIGPAWRMVRSRISSRVITAATAWIRQQAKTGTPGLPWQSLFPGYLSTGHPAGRELLAVLLKDTTQYTAGVAGWNGHARFLFKDNDSKTISVFDPWKQFPTGAEWPVLKQAAADAGWTLLFRKRPQQDQFGEGSCAVQSLMRAILLAEFGRAGADMVVPPDYAVLASFIIGKFRSLQGRHKRKKVYRRRR